MMANMWRTTNGIAFGIALAGLTSLGGVAARAANEMSPAVEALVNYDKAFEGPKQSYRIAYLTECVDNPYCLARLEGLKAASEKYGFEFKIFDAQFNPATQAKVVENAVSEGFDAYIFGPTAAQPACNLWNRLLKPTGKPVVTVDVPMCGDANYTEGLAATVEINDTEHFDRFFDRVFSSCEGDCEVAAIGGFVGSDLFTLWQKSIATAQGKYPNVKVVVNDSANFDPRVALKKIQDALLVHPDISVVVSSWDDMTRGAEQAIVAAGKTPGEDIKIFSAGGTKTGVARIDAGAWEMSMTFLPYEESYYAAVAMMMALEGQPINAYVDEVKLPEIVETTGTEFLTKENIHLYTPKY